MRLIKNQFLDIQRRYFYESVAMVSCLVVNALVGDLSWNLVCSHRLFNHWFSENRSTWIFILFHSFIIYFFSLLVRNKLLHLEQTWIRNMLPQRWEVRWRRTRARAEPPRWRREWWPNFRSTTAPRFGKLWLRKNWRMLLVNPFDFYVKISIINSRKFWSISFIRKKDHFP